MRITFDHAEGLFLHGRNPAEAFEISGVLIPGGVEVSAKTVPMPYFVRYARSNDPVSVTFNKAGYPASSFDSRNK